LQGDLKIAAFPSIGSCAAQRRSDSWSEPESRFAKRIRSHCWSRFMV